MANLGVYRSITQVGTYEPFELQVARGQITAHEVVNVFGFSSGTPSSGFIAAWENNTAYAFPTVASTMVVTSSSASDTGVTILISGLDANYDRISESVAVNGTNAVTTTKVFFRIISVVTTAGNAVGTMYVKNAGGTTYAQVAIGAGRTNMSIYTVPAGYTAYWTQFDSFASTSVTSGIFATFRALLTTPAGVNNVTLAIPFINDFSVTRPYPIGYPEKTDVQWQNKSSGAGLAVGSLAIGVLIKNNITGS